MFSSISPETRIVIIDDIQTNLRLLESSVKAFGLRHIISFTDSAAGLEWVKSNPWDLLLLDLDMPPPNGFEILGHLRDRNRSRCPVIILTALDDPESRRRGLELGANDYLTKPVDLPELLLRMRSCLSLAHATASLEQLNQDLENKVRSRTAQLEESYHSAIRAQGRAACYRDNDTGNHIMRIGESAAMVATTLGMPAAWCETIRLAAPMHDLGKIGISDDILLKQGPLTAEERSQMMEHPVIGYTILHEDPGTELSEMAAEIAYCHHEKWDGSGYPRGLAGEAIPLSARIVALCDVYDALRMDRPYKRAWDPDRAQAYIREQAGSHFDPALVIAMVACFPDLEALLAADQAYEERKRAT